MKKQGPIIDRGLLLLLVCFIGTGLLALYAYQEMASSRREAIDSSKQTEACQQYASQIKVLRKKPRKATDSLQTATQFAQTLEKAARSAGIQLEQLIRIDPRPVRQIENTPYREQPTFFEVRDVTLQQLITLLHRISNEHEGTEVVDLRLEPARMGGTGAKDSPSNPPEETWDAEITLTSLVFNL